jgi:hypothetical protein
VQRCSCVCLRHQRRVLRCICVCLRHLDCCVGRTKYSV